MSLGEHLEELRRRLIIALLGLVPIIGVALIFGTKILELILKPAREALHEHGDASQLILTGPLEGFSVYMKVATIITVVVGSPWILFQLWKFVSPGLYSHERRFAYFLVPLSAVLTTCGVLFLYFFIMPMVLEFFLNFNASLGAVDIATAPLAQGVTLAQFPVLPADPPAEAIQVGSAWVNTSLNMMRVCTAIADNVPTISSFPMKASVGVVSEYRVIEYFGLLFTLTIAFAIAFQAPVVVLLLGWAGILDQKTIKKFRRHAILVCAIVAAAITPGDPASMFMLLVPLYLLYELGGVLLRLFPASRVAGKRQRGPRGGRREYDDDYDDARDDELRESRR